MQHREGLDLFGSETEEPFRLAATDGSQRWVAVQAFPATSLASEKEEKGAVARARAAAVVPKSRLKLGRQVKSVEFGLAEDFK